MVNSKWKGKEGELELTRKLRDFGFEARRGQQYCGAKGDADVEGLPGIHIECKRVQRLQIYDAMQQAKNDARKDELPAVFYRRNHAQWLVTMELADWIELYQAWLEALERQDK